MNDEEKGKAKFDEYVKCVNLFTPNMPSELLHEMLMRGVKKDHPNRYSPGESNCKFCRKKCPLFAKNECFKKSVEEQQACKYYSK